MRPPAIALVVCGMVAVSPPVSAAGPDSAGWNGIPWGSSVQTLQKSYPTKAPPQGHRPLCYAGKTLHPTAYVLRDDYRLDDTTFLVTFCFYGGRLDAVDMLAIAAVGSEILTKLPSDLTDHYGPSVFSGVVDGAPGKTLTKWATPRSSISLMDSSEVFRNMSIHSLLLVYISQDFIERSRRGFQAADPAVP